MTQRTDWRAWSIKTMENKIMDYEKKYKENFELAKDWYNDATTTQKEKVLLEAMYPELRESEDERIRKEIVEFIDWAESRGSVRNDWHQKKRPAEWIAYLEKQKEHKPADVSEKIEELCSKYPLNKDIMSKETLSAYHQGLTFGATRIAEYLGEQKPAEWSEFDKGALKDAICAADRLGNDESFNKSNPNLAKAFRVAKDWLKALPERFTLQPEQEVVDRTVFDRIADILRWCDLPIGCPIEDFKQSESEREHLLHIVQCVAHRYANSCKYCKEYSRGYQEGLSVSHWKPSEYTLSLVKKVANGEMLTHMEQMAMETLCNDLQKLL